MMESETIADSILITKSFDRDDFVLLCGSAKSFVVRVSDIMFLEADGNYTNIYLTNGSKITIRKPVSQCENELDASIFFRTSRTFIVNLNFVKKVEMADAKRFMFIIRKDDIRDEKRVILSRKQSLKLRRERSL
jgi:two-component system LytT family response regulator